MAAQGPPTHGSVLLNRTPVSGAAVPTHGQPASGPGGIRAGLIGGAGGGTPIVLNPQGTGRAMIRVPGGGGLSRAPPTQVPAAITSGRNIVISQPGMRPGQPGSTITVPLQTLQGLQPGQGIPTGQAGHLLVKTDNGQYQILRVGQGGAASVATSVATTMGAPSLAPRAPLPLRPGMSVAVTSSVGLARPTMVTSSLASSMRPPNTSSLSTSVAPAASTTASSTAGGGGGGGGSGGMGQQMTPDMAKLKCKNFLATLLKLASEQPPNVAKNVRNLIQGLIDGHVEPEVFTTQLQRELNSSPQPCLVPFLRKSLPFLQSSLRQGELTIDGVRAPPLVNSNMATMGHSPGMVSSAANPTAPGSLRNVRLHTARSIQQQQQQQQQSGPTSLPHHPPLPPPQVLQTRPALPGMIRHPGPHPGQPTASPSHRSASINVLQQQLIQQQQQRLAQQSGQNRQPMAVLKSTIAPTPATPSTPRLSGPAPVTPSLVKGLPGNMPGLARPPTLPPPKLAVPPSVKEKRSSSTFSTAGDEDINDVAAMGGVNLAEESQRMQGVTDMIGTQIRSCKDETFLQTGQLHQRIAKICRDKGLEEPSSEVIALVSHATQDRLKTLLEKLSVIAEHRMDVIKLEGDHYEISQDVKSQLRFLNDLDRLERRRHEEAEREILLKAAKSRTKTEDPEKEKLKAKARELQRLEEEQLRHEKANNTALLAIGGSKKRLKLDDSFPSGGRLGGPGGGPGGSMPPRSRTKRVHLRDLLFLMEQDKALKRSPLLWKAYNAS
ncbi:hypothetical protein TCAL_08386 [Tigriopus californicus]|uniref:TAFH domain-containing protein n=1 Tax=Tigriopus californicus TaxID=6832 RepID=A0A553PCZ5_TIGCA|nr:transcription initiation factor TFIID subunit 4-like [Tigriopus californicus]TRY75530.1 hypothetical protein TCAL_08386 [Tigriopus californicus]|eukprot:TCALIF_08386-PA protein Name:"Similar to Taf4 Transcription initiation factor TFIID subunit 4 (Drosophila melanogaster)" AED:0.01 eAED:0.03 QI:0/-1/0/1/-1/1/1/0/775